MIYSGVTIYTVHMSPHSLARSEFLNSVSFFLHSDFQIAPSVGVTLVVSPLVSLMEDQTLAMEELGVPAALLSSSTPPDQVRIYAFTLKWFLKIGCSMVCRLLACDVTRPKQHPH